MNSNKETFDRPKVKNFTIKVEFNSNKPNRIISDSRDKGEDFMEGLINSINKGRL
jgi:hypothetical protein